MHKHSAVLASAALIAIIGRYAVANSGNATMQLGFAAHDFGDYERGFNTGMSCGKGRRAVSIRSCGFLPERARRSAE